MGLPKGRTNNPNGRKQGTPNKVTADLREKINTFIDNNIDSIQEDYNKLDPKDKLSFIEKLFSYTVPKLQSVNQQVSFEQLTDEDLDKIINRLTDKL